MTFWFRSYFRKKSHVIFDGIFLMGIIIVVDQVIKYFVLQSRTIEHLCNYGIAMGIVLPTQAFAVVWIVLIGIVGYFWWKHIDESFWIQIPYTLILAGGFSNIIDRIFRGCVVDFIPFLNISSFNIADVFITIGATIILWQNFFDNDKQV